MSAGIRQSVRHPRMSDSKVVVVDASSWIVEAFLFFDIFDEFVVIFIWLFFGMFGVVLIGRISCWIE